MLDLNGSGLTYKAGDALGVYPENCPDLVAGGARGPRRQRRRRRRRRRTASRSACTTRCSATTRSRSPSRPGRAAGRRRDRRRPRRARSRRCVDDDGRRRRRATTCSTCSGSSPRPGPTPDDVRRGPVAARSRGSTRSRRSPQAHPDEVHLTVGVVRYLERGGRAVQGRRLDVPRRPARGRAEGPRLRPRLARVRACPPTATRR